jgi:hypothetical protein
VIFNKSSKLFQQLKKQAQNTDIYTSVTFEDCKFSTIVNELFNEKNLDLPNLKTINFNNTEIEEIQSNIFDSKVTKLIMNYVKINEFTTEIFRNLNSNARIEIMNSQLRGWTQKDILKPFKLKELTFDNVTIETSLSKQFINIQADRVFIKNCSLKSFKTGKGS